MPVNVTINIVDARNILKKALEETYPGLDVTGITVMSWNTTLFQTQGDYLESPRHQLREEHSMLPKISTRTEEDHASGSR